MTAYYPLMLDVQGRLCLIVGGGAVAQRKASALLDAGAQIRVVAPDVVPTIETWAEAGKLELRRRPYVEEDMNGAFLVCVATDNRAVNAAVAAQAHSRNVLLNVADAPEEGNFITPSVVRRGDFCLSLSTGGNSPALNARLTDELQARFGPEYADLVKLLGEMRDSVQQATADVGLRRRALAALADEEAALRALLQTGDADGQTAARTRALALVDNVLSRRTA